SCVNGRAAQDTGPLDDDGLIAEFRGLNRGLLAGRSRADHRTIEVPHPGCSWGAELGVPDRSYHDRRPSESSQAPSARGILVSPRSRLRPGGPPSQVNGIYKIRLPVSGRRASAPYRLARSLALPGARRVI